MHLLIAVEFATILNIASIAKGRIRLFRIEFFFFIVDEALRNLLLAFSPTSPVHHRSKKD